MCRDRWYWNSSPMEGQLELMVESRELWTLKPKLWTSQILNFDPFGKLLCYCTCLCEMFEVNYFRGKYNQRLAAPFMPSIVLWIVHWDS